MNEKKAQNWFEIANELNALIEEVGATIDPGELVLLREFVENREYGVAVEWLHPLVLRGFGPGSSQTQKLRDLASSMKLELVAFE